MLVNPSHAVPPCLSDSALRTVHAPPLPAFSGFLTLLHWDVSPNFFRSDYIHVTIDTHPHETAFCSVPSPWFEPALPSI